MKSTPIAPLTALLLALLVTGCAQTPSQEASIEDRAAKATDPVAAEKAAAEKAAAEAAAQAAKSASAEVGNTAGATPADPGKVTTQALAAPEAEVKTLGGSGPVVLGPDGKPLPSGAAAGGAGAAAAGPILDPKNPASPLIQRRILFDYDSAAIRDEYRSLLEAHAQYLKQTKDAKAILQGHADERGSREYNLALGQRRSESVYKALNLLGVPDAQIEAVSLGEEKPVAEGHDEDAWKQNRRAEILYQGE
ncbi:MAG: peptidoglycan-associated lipoprotein Pal [Pseudomonadota bacterium]